MADSVLIERVFCGNKFSAFLTNTGEFWASGNCSNAGKEAVAKAEAAAAAAQEIPEEEQKLTAKKKKKKEEKEVK